MSDLELFQSFSTEVALNDLEWPILPNLELFKSFPTEVDKNDLELQISPNLKLLQLKHIIFGEMPKFFNPCVGGGAHWQFFLSFSKFLNNFK